MNMLWYILRRTLWAVLAAFVILTITFLLIRFTPNPGVTEDMFATAVEGGDPERARQRARERRGLDQPVHEQYIGFMIDYAQFEWGWSRTRNQPVSEAILEAIPYSMAYGVPSTILSIVLGIGIGLYSATHQYTNRDYAATFFAFFGLSIPDFWFAIMLILVFGVILADTPLAVRTSYSTRVPFWSLENARQFVLPTVVLTLTSIASLMRYSRAQALEYVEAEFVKTAKAKGVEGRDILYKHILRPASVPLATILVGDILGILLVASYVIEVVFNIPGLGVLSYRAIITQDTELLLATVLIPAFVTIIGNLAQDVAYVLLDPRIQYGDM